MTFLDPPLRRLSSPQSAARAARRGMGTFVCVALLSVTGCTAGEQPPTPQATSSPTTESKAAATFPELKRNDPGTSDLILDLAARGDQVVTAGVVSDGRIRVALRHSADRGKTWELGTINGGSGGIATQDLAYVVTRGRKNWLAVGKAGEKMATWTSSDGRKWTQHTIAGRELNGENDSVEDLVAVGSGYLLIGNRQRSTNTRVPAVWHSRDGRHWRYQKLPGSGDLAAASVQGKSVVVVGESKDNARIWISTNGARTWRRTSPELPRVVGSTYLSDITRWGNGFRAVGAQWLDRWQPMIVTSSDGKRWEYHRGQGASQTEGHRLRWFSCPGEWRRVDLPAKWGRQKQGQSSSPGSRCVARLGDTTSN